MEQASTALAEMDYLTCEDLCERALAEARQLEDWAYYGRVLLPLQEARRQRRLTAADGLVRLGTRGLEDGPDAWLERLGEAGCIAVTPPHDARTAAALWRLARTRRRFVEVLWVPSSPDAGPWMLASYAEPRVTCEVSAPPEGWRDRWLRPNEGVGRAAADTSTAQPSASWPSPADWFLDATEALGDAAIAAVTDRPGTRQRLERLEAMLAAAPDHELLHQRLADAARDLLRAMPTTP